MAIQDRNLTAGTRLAATYKEEVHFCDVEVTEDGKLAFVLTDGRRFKSASSAASALMAGKAVNGWIFWSITQSEQTPVAHADQQTSSHRRGKRLLYRLPNQNGLAEGKSRWFCNGCMKSFIVDKETTPEACSEGHRISEAELPSAPAAPAVSHPTEEAD